MSRTRRFLTLDRTRCIVSDTMGRAATTLTTTRNMEEELC